MKTIVLYQSSTGCTKKYAEDIAEGIHGDVSPLKKFKWRTLKNYDTVVFGGWVMGNTIQGIDKFFQHWKEMAGKDVILFAVGMSLPSKEGRLILIEQNLLDMYHVRFYQVRGSFDMQKLHFPYKFLMKYTFKRIAADPDAGIDQKAILDLEGHPLIVYDSEQVEKILQVLRIIAATPKTVEVESVPK
jgi:flavodoxin